MPDVFEDEKGGPMVARDAEERRWRGVARGRGVDPAGPQHRDGDSDWD